MKFGSARSRLFIGLAAVSLLAAGVYGSLAAPATIAGGKTTNDAGFQTAAPHAILIEAETGTILFEKGADALVAPASLAKLMTAETVFNEIREGNVKLDEEFVVSERAWRKGGAPSGGSTMFAPIRRWRAPFRISRTARSPPPSATFARGWACRCWCKIMSSAC